MNDVDMVISLQTTSPKAEYVFDRNVSSAELIVEELEKLSVEKA